VAERTDHYSARTVARRAAGLLRCRGDRGRAARDGAVRAAIHTVAAAAAAVTTTEAAAARCDHYISQHANRQVTGHRSPRRTRGVLQHTSGLARRDAASVATVSRYGRSRAPIGKTV